MNNEEIERWITVKGNKVPIKKGQSVEDAIAERFDSTDDVEIDIETDDLDDEIEAPSDELITTQYFLEGYGSITKTAYENLKAQGKNVYTKITKTPVDDLPYAKLSKREGIKEAAKKVNPNFSSGDFEWTYNCQRCVIALEMRIRGYDVTAKMRLQNDNIFSTGTAWTESWEGFEWKQPGYYYATDNRASAEVYERQMVKQGEGARFVMCIQWRKHSWQDKAGGHTLMAIVEDGKINYYDPQTGKKANTWKYRCNPAGTMYARVDNLHMTDKVSNCVYDKDKHPTRKSLTRGWLTKEESEEGYEAI